MGAIYLPWLKDLQQILKCNDRQIRQLGRQMPETVIMGSLEIWRQDTYHRHQDPMQQNAEIIEEEIAELEQIDRQQDQPRDETSEDEKEDKKKSEKKKIGREARRSREARMT
jgi:hypothetical protein